MPLARTNKDSLRIQLSGHCLAVARYERALDRVGKWVRWWRGGGGGSKWEASVPPMDIRRMSNIEWHAALSDSSGTPSAAGIRLNACRRHKCLKNTQRVTPMSTCQVSLRPVPSPSVHGSLRKRASSPGPSLQGSVCRRVTSSGWLRTIQLFTVSTPPTTSGTQIGGEACSFQP